MTERKPKTTSSDRMARLRERNARLGRKRVEFYLTSDERDALRARLKELRS